MSDLLKTCKYLLAGNARFTVAHPESGARFTYHVYTAKNGRDKGVTVAKLLTGPNNTADYTRIGIVDVKTGEIELDANIGTGKAGVPESAALIRWFCRLAVAGADVPEGLELIHAGCCLACGRTLTVPYPDNPYRIYGLGPDCGAK